MIGIEFNYKDGTNEYYDPISDWEENQKEYAFYVLGNQYVINKEEVISVREYECCEKCGHEVFYDGCRRCYMETELKLLRDE